MIYPFTEQEIAVNKLRESKKTYKEIGELMRVSQNRARQVYVQYKRKEKYNAVINDYVKGEEIEAIALKYQYPVATVGLLIDKYNKKRNK